MLGDLSGVSKIFVITGRTDMGCSAFTLKNARITVGFTQDAQGHIFIDRSKLGMAVTEKKEIGKAAKQK